MVLVETIIITIVLATLIMMRMIWDFIFLRMI